MAFAQGKPLPRNVYQQLCKVNPEWHKNKWIAQQLGLLQAPTIENEQDLLAFHLQILGKVFSQRIHPHLSVVQQRNRQTHLQVLEQYRQLRNCPRNDYLPYRNPVFIDHKGRYCAVGYLMLKSGKKAFCQAVQRSNNFIKIREITSPEFTQWQVNSGLSLDELAWIQPYYTPQVRYEKVSYRLGTPRTPRFLDSLQSLKLNRPGYKHLLTHQFAEIFMNDQSFDVHKKLKKLRYWGKPNWKTLKKQHMAVTNLILYGGNLYAMANSIRLVESEKWQFAIFKWDSQNNQWTRFDTEAPIYTFFTHQGRLYAGGGYETFTKAMEDNMPVQKPKYTHSYLLQLQGKTWKKIDQEYGGIIFGLYRKGAQSYLATVINTSLGSKRAPIVTKTNK